MSIIIIRTSIPIIAPNKASLHEHSHFTLPMKQERERQFIHIAHTEHTAEIPVSQNKMTLKQQKNFNFLL